MMMDVRDTLVDAPALNGVARQGPFFTELVDDPELLELVGESWHDLSGRALVPNANYSPDSLLPTIRHFAETHDFAGCILAWRQGGPGTAPRLVGLMPCRRPRFRWGVPVHTLTNWALPQLGLGVPLLDRTCAEEALAAILAHARDMAGPPGVLILEEIDGAGPFHHVLQKVLTSRRLPSSVPYSFERAVFEPDGDFESYQQAHFKGKTRQTYRRKRKKLGELDRLDTVLLESWDDIEPELDAFFALEGSGWKRRSGSALICDPAWRGWYHDVVRNTAQSGHCVFAALKLAGYGMLAAAFVDLRGETAGLGKIAYDESFARFSPGGLLTLDLLEAMSGYEGLALFDSCARPDNATLYALFKQRRPIEHRVIGLVPGMMSLRFAPVAGLESLRRSAGPRAKAILQRLRPS